MKCAKCGHNDEKILLLKLELEALEKRVKETELEFNTSMKFLRYAEKLDRTKPESRDVFFKMMKEGISTELEQFRAKTEMIRKISPESADYLQQELNSYEETLRVNFENLRKTSDPNFWLKASYQELTEIMLRMFTMNSKIALMLNLCKNCIRDTIKRLE